MHVCASGAHAQDYNPDTEYLANRTTYGDLGIIEMPSARMAQDGQMSITAAGFNGTQRYGLGFQILPWMEASFRYSRIEDRGRNPPDYDRSFGLKLRLSQEGEYLPEISLGVRDLLGTGILGQEYLVATKSIWDFDVTAGLGWGRLASDGMMPNPIGLIFKSFNHRGGRGNNPGGVPIFTQLFHGPDSSVFGGIVWHTPVENVDLLAEFSSDRYVRESRPGAGPFRYKSPINFGVAYHPFDWFSISTSWLYGDTFGVVVNVSADPTKPNFPAHLGPEPMPVTMRSDDEQRAAVAEFVNDRVSTAAIGEQSAWVDVSDHRELAKAQLTSELTSLNGQVADFEIDGQTLMINLRGERNTAQRCKVYARLAANSSMGLHSVAVTDLGSPNGNVAICEVPDLKPQTVLAARNDDGDLISADAATSTTLDAPPAADPPPVNPAEIEKKIRADADAQSIGIDAISIGPHEAVVYLDNGTYYFESEAIGRMVRILMADAPPGVEMFRIVSDIEGVPVRQVKIDRAAAERMFMNSGRPVEISNAIRIVPAARRNPVLDSAAGQLYPAFSWSFGPQLREGLFDPKAPIEFQIAGVASASVILLPGLSLNAVGDGNIWDDYNLTRKSNSQLPHVRSDVYQYLRHGINGISALSVDYVTTLAPDLYVMGRAGILEDMFTGAGGQILWRPEGERWAVGADVYEVWQRGFDRLFDLRNYHVTTGHVSIYYQSPWYGLNFAVHAGRYLAGDYGATFEIRRRFDTGVEIGAWATFTNVPFKQFGEGSFDKGIYVNIPLEWLLPFFTQSSYNLALRPLARDGGQRLIGDDSLYGLTESTSENAIASHVDDIAYPPR